MNMQRGFRDKLEKHLDIGRAFQVVMNIEGQAEYDFCCFGVDKEDKLSDDRYMVFYNQPTSPQNEISLRQANGHAEFTIDLSRLPDFINKIVFTANIDARSSSCMSEIASHEVYVSQNGQPVLELNLTGKDFTKEKAIISIEIYKKNVWRLAAVASGFFGGLGDLLRSYGGEELTGDNSASLVSKTSSSPQHTEPTQIKTSSEPLHQPKQEQTQQAIANTPLKEQPGSTAKFKVSLEKKIEKEAPQLVSLAKTFTVSLKKNNLEDCRAKVALVLDMSGSMSFRYQSGMVQEFVNRVVPVAVQFDDDGEFDCWFFGDSYKRVPSVNLRNYKDTVPENWFNVMRDLGFLNNEPKVMLDVLSNFKNSQEPVYVIFLSDGGVSKAEEIQKVLIEASKYPIFWQFVGIGGKMYGILEQLDTMPGRYIDNANFFALDDLHDISDAELYDRMLREFPLWLKEIKQRGMI